MSPALADIIGLIGSALFIAAFAYANASKSLNKVWFNASNLAGAILLLISLSVTFNLAAFVLEAAWGTIAAIGLVMEIRNRKSPSRLREGLGVAQSDGDDALPPPSPLPQAGGGE